LKREIKYAAGNLMH
jgi:hypothetical protein